MTTDLVPSRGLSRQRDPSKFGEEFKREAVRWVRTTARTCADVAGELGMNRKTLRTWVRESEAEGSDSGGGLAQAERDELRPVGVHLGMQRGGDHSASTPPGRSDRSPTKIR